MPDNRPASPAEIEALLGPRGRVTITMENRGLARRWIAAKGWGAGFAAILSLKELNIAYNRPGAGEFGKDNWLMRRHAQWTIKRAAQEEGKGDETAQGFESDTGADMFGDTFSPKDDDRQANDRDAMGKAHNTFQAAQDGDAEARARVNDAVKAVTGKDAQWSAQDDKTAMDKFQATIAPRDTTTHSAQDAIKLAQALQEILSRGQSVDASQVEAIIERKWSELPELIAKHSPLTTIKIERQDGTAHTVEGHAHEMLKDLITAAASRQPNGFHPNIMLCGPTGSGKTHACAQAAAALGLEFYSNGAVSMDHQLIGFRDAQGNYHETPLRKAFDRPAWYLFDEADASDNSPLLCVAAVLANGHYDFPDGKIARHPDSVISAAGNTWGLGATSDFVGRAKLDGAIRSRFPVRIMWGYDERLERAMSGNIDWAVRVQRARHAAAKAGLKVIIDPRMTQAGAALIAQGMSEQRAAELTYLADLSAEQRALVEA